MYSALVHVQYQPIGTVYVPLIVGTLYTMGHTDQINCTHRIAKKPTYNHACIHVHANYMYKYPHTIMHYCSNTYQIKGILSDVSQRPRESGTKKLLKEKTAQISTQLLHTHKQLYILTSNTEFENLEYSGSFSRLLIN